MDSTLVWYGLGLLLIATVFWAAVWWWLPALFRDRDERPGPPPERTQGREPPRPGEERGGGRPST